MIWLSTDATGLTSPAAVSVLLGRLPEFTLLDETPERAHSGEATLDHRVAGDVVLGRNLAGRESVVEAIERSNQIDLLLGQSIDETGKDPSGREVSVVEKHEMSLSR